ncbi:uncharacterized protein LOC128224525 isoform X2 [Mya arenaria]|uniref:uncharacterized protein LOC128224525 isoform X2 n=1 Tax=Mya arenaria TaxID=6604 RepID=UPI0022E587B4|nr:uncharacterized protein LOC128224525 isoform X2 [Mya arenaria]
MRSLKTEIELTQYPLLSLYPNLVPLVSSRMDTGEKESADSEHMHSTRAILQFLAACFLIIIAVGLGSVWHFLFLCYKNQGGAFLMQCCSLLAVICLSLFYMEISNGHQKVNLLFKGCLFLVFLSAVTMTQGPLIPDYSYSGLGLCSTTEPEFCARAKCRKCIPQSCSDANIYVQRFREGCCKTDEAKTHQKCISICSADGARYKLKLYDSEMGILTTLCPEGQIIKKCLLCKPCFPAMCKHWADKEVFDDQCRPQLGSDHPMVKQCEYIWNEIISSKPITTSAAYSTKTPANRTKTRTQKSTTPANRTTTPANRTTTPANRTTTPANQTTIVGIIIGCSILATVVAIAIIDSKWNRSRCRNWLKACCRSHCMSIDTRLDKVAHLDGNNLDVSVCLQECSFKVADRNTTSLPPRPSIYNGHTQSIPYDPSTESTSMEHHQLLSVPTEIHQSESDLVEEQQLECISINREEVEPNLV